MSLLFTAASRATASKNSDRHAMLNAIQHGVTIADLQIRRTEQQCGLRSIGDWVGSCRALVAKVSGCFWNQKTEHKNKGSRSRNQIGGNEWTGPPTIEMGRLVTNWSFLSPH